MAAAMSQAASTVSHPCSIAVPHDPHVWISAIGGGAPGPVPQLTLVCPGVKAEP